MITKDEKHIIAITMAVMTGVMTLSTMGLSVYAESAPTSTQNVEVGKRYETNISSAKDIPKYQFTPETTGTYHFYSEGNEDTYGYVYDANQNLISSDNDSGEELNFSMDMNCEAGETYYLAASYFMEEQTGTIQWKVEQEDTEIQENNSNITSEFQNDEDVDIQEETYSESEKLSAPVEKNSEGDYEFADLSDGTVEITGYTGNDISIKIPGTLAGKEVSSIGEAAFKNNNEIKSVEIPKSVTSLQYMSFDSCDELQDVLFEEESHLNSIDRFTFYYCTKLKNIVLPNEIKEIGKAAFLNTGLTKIDLPECIENIEGWAFASCRQLEAVKLGGGINEIKKSTFSSCPKLTEIKIPDSIKSIGDWAFMGSGLKRIDIPDSVESIGEEAFQWCGDLEQVSIGNSLCYVSDSAFRWCNLKEISIGSKIKCIQDHAFEYNTTLKEISIPKNVTEIQYSVFKGCEALEKIDFPDTLEKIGGFSFKGTKWLADQKDGVVYAGKVLYTYKGDMPKETSIDVKKGTKGISGFAFDDQVKLKSISIPEGVTNIGDYALHNCSSMTQISIPKSVNEIGEYALGYKEVNNGTQGERYESSRYSKWGYHMVIPGFVIYGEAGSVAEKYAKRNNINFKKNVHTVIFKDGNKIIDTQKVTSGENAKAPEIIKEGYIFKGWSGDYTNVTSDITVTAKWAVDEKTKTGVFQASDGSWYYYKNGQKDISFTGLGENEHGVWYCKKGKVQFNVTDVIESKGVYNGWYYVKKGQLQIGEITVKGNKNGWWYIDKNGKVDFNFTGLAKNENGIWYCKKGQVQFNTTDVIESKGTYNGWYYVKKGQLRTGNETVEQNKNGWWYINKDGKVDFNFNGLAKNGNGIWYCKKGQVQFNTTDVLYSKGTYEGWYYVKKGQLQTGKVTVEQNSIGWWYIGTDGKVDFSFTGIASNAYGSWYIEKGKVNFSKNMNTYIDPHTKLNYKVVKGKATRIK